VSGAEEAIEMLYAGASAVGLCSAPLVEGVEVFARIRDRMAQRLSELGMASVREAVGAASDAEARLSMRLDEAACTGCGACIRVCPYGARRGPAAVDASCRGCGLCVSLCPTGALGGKGSER
jgi:dihydroorotate dehydrogenase (fumarate)